MTINVLKVVAPGALAFFIGLILSPSFIKFLVQNKLWKKKNVALTIDGKEATISSAIHADETKKTPRMGGVIVWGTTLITITLFWVLAHLFPSGITEKLNFLSRNQTWLPLFTLICGSLVGLIDDILVVQDRGTYIGKGLPLSLRIGTVFIIGLVGAWWFYYKLGASSIHIPGGTFVDIGLWFFPVFILTMIALFSGGVIDGIDGLSGGVMASIFFTYGAIAFFQSQINLAAFCSVIGGSILAFLWFNIPPAQYYMSETGIIGLTTTLTVVAFLTNSAIELPVIALPLFMASGSVIVQLLSKKFRGKKVFLVAPIHHHFEALGWPSYKVTMRFWIIAVITALIGLMIALL
jgi:phospho-N-acetylmuramoyl-pentapeptide-transferase